LIPSRSLELVSAIQANYHTVVLWLLQELSPHQYMLVLVPVLSAFAAFLQATTGYDGIQGLVSPYPYHQVFFNIEEISRYVEDIKEI
jgi:uncharacterized membrane protein